MNETYSSRLEKMIKEILNVHFVDNENKKERWNDFKSYSLKIKQPLLVHDIFSIMEKEVGIKIAKWQPDDIIQYLKKDKLPEATYAIKVTNKELLSLNFITKTWDIFINKIKENPHKVSAEHWSDFFNKLLMQVKPNALKSLPKEFIKLRSYKILNKIKHKNDDTQNLVTKINLWSNTINIYTHKLKERPRRKI